SGFTLDKSQINTNAHYIYRKTAVDGETSWVLTPTSSAGAAWYVMEHAGLLTASTPVDKTVSNGTGSGVHTWDTGTTATTTQAAELLLASFGWSKTAPDTNDVLTWTNSFAERG